MEIERKFLVPVLPENLSEFNKKIIKQGYISTSPVIRIRQSNEKFILTVKSKGLLSREEFELPLTEEEFNELSKKVSGNVISKVRYIIPIDNRLKIELDVFDGLFSGLNLAEVEFSDENEANDFIPPSLFGKEVTYDTHFHNSTMSNMTPEEISSLIESLSNQ